MDTDTITAPSSPTLLRLLDEELAFSPSIHRLYSNHLAMALVALEQLGAGPDVLERTFETHAADDGAEMRDDRSALDERVAEVARDGIAATVRARVPRLAHGPATALFHPLIRLAYALDVSHQGQVAAALLDWERRHEVLPTPTPSPGPRRLPDVAAALAAQPGTWSETYDFEPVAQRPELRAALEGCALDEHTLDDLSAFAIAAHVTADHFVTLHLVTGARAVRAVAGWLDPEERNRLAAHALPEMAVAYAAVGAPPLLGPADLDAVRHAALPARATIAERAVAHRDPHVIKLANVALVEEERTADPLYRYAAARVVGLAGPA